MLLPLRLCCRGLPPSCALPPPTEASELEVNVATGAGPEEEDGGGVSVAPAGAEEEEEEGSWGGSGASRSKAGAGLGALLGVSLLSSEPPAEGSTSSAAGPGVSPFTAKSKHSSRGQLIVQGPSASATDNVQ